MVIDNELGTMQEEVVLKIVFGGCPESQLRFTPGIPKCKSATVGLHTMTVIVPVTNSILCSLLTYMLNVNLKVQHSYPMTGFLDPAHITITYIPSFTLISYSKLYLRASMTLQHQYLYMLLISHANKIIKYKFL